MDEAAGGASDMGDPERLRGQVSGRFEQGAVVDVEAARLQQQLQGGADGRLEREGWGRPEWGTAAA